MANIALLPGGFKPPHAGHYAVAKFLSQKSGAEVLVRVGAKERDNVTQNMSIKIWNIYGIKAEPASSDSPIADVFKYVEEKATQEDTIYIGTGEKDFPRFKVLTDPSFKPENYKKYNPKGVKVIEIPIPPQAGGVSGTKMREFIMNDQKDQFQDFLPDHVDKDKVWNIVIGLKEDLYNPEDKVLDYMKSSEFKAGYTKPDDITPGYKYRRGGQWGTGMYESDEKGKILHAYDFDDTIAQVKANIKTTITSPSGDYNKEILIPAANFPEESKELEARLGSLEINYDFSEFEKQIGDAIINSKVVSKLKDSLSRPEVKTTILTARSIGHPVTRYLKSIGLDAYVVPLGLQVDGKVTGQDKANWIENHIKKGYQTIYFIDDSEENRTAVAALKDKHPDVNLTVEDPAAVREINEGPQFGVLYHFTQYLLDVLDDNILRGPISLTRSLDSHVTQWLGDQPYFIFDKDKLRTKYKITPFKDTSDNPDYEPISQHDEMEEVIENDITDLAKYTIKVVLPYSDENWENALKEKNIPYEVKALDEMMGTMNNQEKAKHAKNLKRLKKDTAKQGDKYMEVPSYLKGTLTRKMYEMKKGLSDKEQKIVDDILGNSNNLQEIVMKNILNKVKQYSKKGLLSLAIVLAVVNSVSAQTTDADTIKFLDGIIVINDVKTNAEYYQAMLSLVNEEIRTKRIKRDTVEYKALKEVEIYYYDLINGAEYFNIEHLSPQAEKVENKLQQYLINNPEKLQFHINRGKKYNTKNLDLSPDAVYGDPNLDEAKLFSKDWWKKIINEVMTETKANTHLTHLEELVLTQGQDGYNKAKSFLYELIKNLKGESNNIKNVSVKWDGAPAIFTGINPENGKFFVGTKSVFNVNPKINYTFQDIDTNHGHAAGLAKKLKLALQYLPALGINGILQGDFMFDSDDVDTQNIDDKPHYTFKPNTIRYAVETNSDLGEKINTAKIGIIFHTTYNDLSGGGASFGADVSGLSKSPSVWFDDAYFKDDTGVLLSDEEENLVLEKIKNADSINVDYTNLPLKSLNTYLNSEIRQGEFLNDPIKSFTRFKEWYQLAVNKSIEKVKRPETKEKKKQAGEEKLKEFESQKQDILNLFKISKLLSEAKSIFITKYDKAVSTKHFIDNGDGTLSVTKAEGFVAVDHTENGIKLVDRLEFSRNNFNAGKPGS